ncbi:MAG TPA: hypothetical protein VHC95_12295 [Opitutales bacterium]|nr:hypothetical protein [Opitutales bacterium]
MEPLAHDFLRDTFARQPLFQDKTWRLSPTAWPVSPAQFAELERIGEACLAFMRALEVLYTRSWQGKNLLRNRELFAPWVAGYLDRGKPERLIAHQRHPSTKNKLPNVLRPDLLLTEEGFALTEIDAVPGGLGLTAFLNRLYDQPGAGVVGANDLLLEEFYATLAALAPKKAEPFIAIVVSDEAATYLPEFTWIAARLRERGHRVHVLHPTEIMPLGHTLCAPVDGNPEQIDVLYRFFELFDLANVRTADFILTAAEAGEVVVTPPMRAFQEEKLTQALLHHPQLEDFWRENLPRGSWPILKKLVPRSWVVDPVELPPNAVLDAPWVGGKPIHRWEQLAEASQKERNLILKVSGFHETAWGARSVVLGSDVPRDEWLAAIRHAMEMAPRTLHVLQEYRKPMRLKHPVYNPEGQLYEMEGRLRLTPFYLIRDDQVHIGGALATFCPADKKIIHGMKDAAMLPTAVGESALVPSS